MSKLFLQFFAEDAPAGAPTDSGAGNAADTSAAAGLPAAGTSAADSGNQGGGQPAGEQEVSFKDFLEQHPNYKKDHEAMVKAAVTSRIKPFREERATTDRAFAILAKHYGMDTDGKIDRKAIADRIESDDSLLEDLAMQNGMSTDGMKRVMEADRILREQAERKAGEDEEREFRALYEEAEAMKNGNYPGFDFLAEIENNEPFFKMVAGLKKMGFSNPVEAAYRAMNFDKIVTERVDSAVSDARKQFSASVQSGAMRPAENGVSGTAAETKLDPRKLTPAQRKEIRKRVYDGEEVTFG